MSSHIKKPLTLKLPDGRLLLAKAEDDPVALCIAIYLQDASTDDKLLCFAEYDRENPKEQKIYIGAYTESSSGPAYHDFYHNAKEV